MTYTVADLRDFHGFLDKRPWDEDASGMTSAGTGTAGAILTGPIRASFYFGPALVRLIVIIYLYTCCKEPQHSLSL
jgi:hypothetical protein